MEGLSEKVRNQKQLSLALLLAGLLFISGCNDPMALPAYTRIFDADRTIAIVYKVKATQTTDQVPCYRIRDDQLVTLTTLKDAQLVDIVAIEEGLREFDGQLWLRIYPRLTHRPSCYVNIDNLIPFS